MLGDSNSPIIFVSRTLPFLLGVQQVWKQKSEASLRLLRRDPCDDDEEKTQPSTDKWGAADWLRNSSKSIHCY